MAVRRVCYHWNYNLGHPDLLAFPNVFRNHGMRAELRQGRGLVGNLADLLVGYEDNAVLSALLRANPNLTEILKRLSAQRCEPFWLYALQPAKNAGFEPAILASFREIKTSIAEASSAATLQPRHHLSATKATPSPSTAISDRRVLFG